MINGDNIIEVPTVGDRKPRKVKQRIMGQILEPRIEEMLIILNQEMIDSSYKDRLNAGVVICGGTGLLEHIVDLAEQIFDLPVRIGYPRDIHEAPESTNSPQHATGVGLVFYASRHASGKKWRVPGKKAIGGVVGWVKGWFSNNL
jgi:cell division protein FtsA